MSEELHLGKAADRKNEGRFFEFAGHVKPQEPRPERQVRRKSGEMERTSAHEVLVD